MRIDSTVELAQWGKLMIRRFLGLEPWLSVQVERPRCYYGNRYARWCVDPSLISNNSVVYSFGVGNDISFDIQLIHSYQLTVHAFDPTPRSIDWIGKQQLPEQFVFHDFGIAAFDGIAHFSAPSVSSHVSHQMIVEESTVPSPITGEVQRLDTIMSHLGHQKIDILKMDVEGAEYSVLDDILASSVCVEQILVEFHHRFPTISVSQTKTIVDKLNLAGFRIFDISLSGEEFSFIHRGLL